MNSRSLLMAALVVLCLIQIYAPLSMIFAKEDVLRNGTAYRFRIQPVDPTDPFRGKYVTLRFHADKFTIKSRSDWHHDDEIYVLLSTDSSGFAQVDNVLKHAPEQGADYIKASLSYLDYNDTLLAHIAYPFDRYYMDEFKAPEAERRYGSAAADPVQTPYALICVKKGDAVIKDVLVNNVSLKDIH